MVSEYYSSSARWLMHLAVAVVLCCLTTTGRNTAPLGTTTLVAAAAAAEDDFDFFLFVRQFGPSYCEYRSNSCSVDPFNQFTIHGLWPNYYNGWPQYCDSSDRFSTRNLESDTLKQMDCEWISLTGSDEGFWNHEWSKHGTCSLSVLPTQEDYFAKALELNSQYDLNVALEENGIDLSSGDDVRTEDVEEAIQEAFGVSGAVFKCSRNALVEIQMCIDKTTFEAFSCPSSLSTTCSSYVDIPSSSSGDVPAQCAAYFPDGQKTSSSSSSSSTTTTTQGEDSGTSSSSSYYSSFFSMMMMMMMMIVIVFVSVV
ncbi:hypothetical protein M9434_000386 [Picochlorum sp. BPE23]|nr:hypothetical protein M9434_000386 [Picochlorum sp. BPE23]